MPPDLLLWCWSHPAETRSVVDQLDWLLCSPTYTHVLLSELLSVSGQVSVDECPPSGQVSGCAEVGNRQACVNTPNHN